MTLSKSFESGNVEVTVDYLDALVGLNKRNYQNMN